MLGVGWSGCWVCGLLAGCWILGVWVAFSSPLYAPPARLPAPCPPACPTTPTSTPTSTPACTPQSRLGEEALVVAYRATKGALARRESRRGLLAEMVGTVFGGDGARAAKYQPLIQRLVEEDEKLAALRHSVHHHK